jgi:hypothetical protein
MRCHDYQAAPATQITIITLTTAMRTGGSPLSGIEHGSTGYLEGLGSLLIRLRNATNGRQAVEFGVEIGQHRGGGSGPARIFQRCARGGLARSVRRGALSPADPVRDNRPAEAGRRQLTENGNTEIDGRDLRKDFGSGPPFGTAPTNFT